MASSSRYLVPVALAAAAGLVVLARRTGPTAATLSARLRASALASLPDTGVIVTLGSAEWDLMLGGRKPDYLGGPTWGFYSTFAGTNADGTARKGGTTCGTVAAYWAAKAGFPVELIDRLPSDPVPGSGFNPGASISKLYAGAKARGWMLSAPSSSTASSSTAVSGVGAAGAVELQAGDYYCVVHDGATYNGQASSGEHVGVVLDVSAPNAEGSRTVRTADGGQTCGGNQCAHWNTRTLTRAGQLVLDGAAGRLAWIVRAP